MTELEEMKRLLSSVQEEAPYWDFGESIIDVLQDDIDRNDAASFYLHYDRIDDYQDGMKEGTWANTRASN